jgi:hypothetical protein
MDVAHKQKILSEKLVAVRGAAKAGRPGQKRAPAPVAWMIIFLLLKQYFCFLNSISASHK